MNIRKDLKVKESVLKEFYRTELIDDEKIIDNSDLTIARKLKLGKHIVLEVLIRHDIENRKYPRNEKPLVELHRCDCFRQLTNWCKC